MATRLSLLTLAIATCAGALRRHSKKGSLKKTEPEFALGSYGENWCSGDYQRIDDEALCRKAVSALSVYPQTMNFFRSTEQADAPKGCITNSMSFVLLNTVSEGTSKASSEWRPICIKKADDKPKAPEPFALGSYGENACSGDWQRIDDEAQCQEAVSALGLMFAASKQAAGEPAGCHTNSMKFTFFNSVSEDKSMATSRYRPVCFSTAGLAPAPKPEPSSGLTWVLGEKSLQKWASVAQNSTCTETCSRKGMTCSASEMTKVTSDATFVRAMQGLGIKCEEFKGSEIYAAPVFNPQRGECFYRKDSYKDSALCDSPPYTDWQRICACQGEQPEQGELLEEGEGSEPRPEQPEAPTPTLQEKQMTLIHLSLAAVGIGAVLLGFFACASRCFQGLTAEAS